jgi:hypothetical protein
MITLIPVRPKGSKPREWSFSARYLTRLVEWALLSVTVVVDIIAVGMEKETRGKRNRGHYLA